MKHILAIVALTAASFGVLAQTSTSQSGSQSGASAGSQSGAASIIYLDQSVRSVDQTTRGTMDSRATLDSRATNNDNITYGGRIVNEQTGTTTSNIVHSGTTTENTNVNYSGTQTLKNVPGIALSGPASAPCAGVSGSVGLAGPGFGVGINGAKEDIACTARENTRLLGMAFQSLDGAAYPQQKGEILSAVMDGIRIIRTLNDKIASEIKAK